MLYPVPAVMVSCGDKEGNKNIITVAWTGTICSEPAMVSISVRPERHSYSMIRESGEFVINLTTKELAYATDWCGVKSGRDVDKFASMNLTAAPGSVLQYAPIIAESPVNMECQVTEMIELGSHHMFLGKIASVMVSEKYMNDTGKFELNGTGLVTYSHGEYFTLGERLGKFGYSVKK
ncbi:MAG: flavin reductase family protein [Lachnospiraceae bacterium]|nr:flavin reductase family protein [Lachnospiraceae bacterium]